MIALTEFLRRLGYLNRVAPDLKGADFENLSEHDQPLVDALELYQDFLKPTLDELCFAIHGREAVVDGHLGPATAFLVDMPRCHCPDFEPDSESDSHKLWSREQANWPEQCRGSLHTGRSFDALPGMNEADTDGVWWSSCHNWSEAISDLQMSPTRNQGEADFWAGLESMRGSTLAWSFLAQNRCDTRLSQAYSTRVNWTRRLAATTKTHEDGHALGLQHQRDSSATMYPSITGISQRRFGYPNSTDIAAMTRLGYMPHENWQERRLPDAKLFLPRDAPDPPEVPTPDLAERVADLEDYRFHDIIDGAGRDALLQWLRHRVDQLEAK